jgi:cation transport ATPase
MFPPGLDSKQGHRSPEQVRRIGRRGRPASLVGAILLLVVFWTFSAGTALWGVLHDHGHDQGSTVAALVFWTVVFTLLMWRAWRGGRKAIAATARIATMLGIVFLIGMVAFTVLLFIAPPGGSVVKSVAYLLPCLLAGVALLTAGILLRRREVSEWSGF